MTKIEFKRKKSLIISGKNFSCGLSNDSDFIEVTEWKNYEGYTISINTSLGARCFELTNEEFNAIKLLIDKFEMHDYDDSTD